MQALTVCLRGDQERPRSLWSPQNSLWELCMPEKILQVGAHEPSLHVWVNEQTHWAHCSSISRHRCQMAITVTSERRCRWTSFHGFPKWLKRQACSFFHPESDVFLAAASLFARVSIWSGDRFDVIRHVLFSFRYSQIPPPPPLGGVFR